MLQPSILALEESYWTTGTLFINFLLPYHLIRHFGRLRGGGGGESNYSRLRYYPKTTGKWQNMHLANF